MRDSLSHIETPLRRRSFLLVTAGFVAGLLLPLAILKSYKVRREVVFPRDMSREEFDGLMASCMDRPAIKDHYAELMQTGDLLSIKPVFESRRTICDLEFKNFQSYEKWVNPIDKNWFNQERFLSLGFKVYLHPLS